MDRVIAQHDDTWLVEGWDDLSHSGQEPTPRGFKLPPIDPMHHQRVRLGRRMTMRADASMPIQHPGAPPGDAGVALKSPSNVRGLRHVGPTEEAGIFSVFVDDTGEGWHPRLT